MPVLDLSQAKQVFLGSVEATSLYLGGTKVWEASGIIWGDFLLYGYTYSPFGLNASLSVDNNKLQAKKIAFTDFIKAFVIQGVTYSVASSTANSFKLDNYPTQSIPETEIIGIVIKEDSFYKNPIGQWYNGLSSTRWADIKGGTLSISENIFKNAKVNPHNVQSIRYDGQIIPVIQIEKSGYNFVLKLITSVATIPSDFSQYTSKSFDLRT